MKILFNYASRSRPELFRRGVESIVNNAIGEYEIIAIVDANDFRIKEYDFTNCTVIYGLSDNKIDAINRGKNYILNSDAKIILNMSDDMVFTQKGFDNIIRESFENLDQYIHFNDGNQRANVSTMHIVGRDYYNRFNYIYNPEYESLWCDVENDIVAKQLGKYKYMGDDIKIFKHLHPAFGLAPTDAQYQRTEAPEMWAKDEATFNRRKEMNFGI